MKETEEREGLSTREENGKNIFEREHSTIYPQVEHTETKKANHSNNITKDRKIQEIDRLHCQQYFYKYKGTTKTDLAQTQNTFTLQ